jgi:hypothetical protein
MDLVLLLKSFLMLFVVMDPVGNIPIFIAITKDFSDDQANYEVEPRKPRKQKDGVAELGRYGRKMKIPDNCYMPDISNLAEKRLMPALMLSLICSKGANFSPKASLYLRNFIRLIDKSIAEYLEARNIILLEIEEKNRSAEEMQETGRFLYFISFVNHAENCINALRRALHLLSAMKSEQFSPAIPKIPRKLIEALGDKIKDIRDTIEHLDEKIQKDEHVQGEPVMLVVTDDERSMSICNQNLKFCELELIIRKLYNIGKYLIEEYRKNP